MVDVKNIIGTKIVDVSFQIDVKPLSIIDSDKSIHLYYSIVKICITM